MLMFSKTQNMKAILNFRTVDRPENVEVEIENWPEVISKGDYFQISACDLGQGVAEVISRTWTCAGETVCLVDCLVKPEVFDELLGSTKLESTSRLKYRLYRITGYRWK